MKRPNKDGKRVVPQPGGESFQLGETVGPPIYHMSMPPVKSYLRWNGHKLELTNPPPVTPTASLIPASEEVAKLPRGAREAFAARCAARVAPLRPNASSPEAAAALILAAATVETPIRRQLLCLRRDFDLLVRLAKQHDWTDETPVPSDVFGPMWHKNIAPEWAKEPAPPAKPDGPAAGTV